MRNYIVVVVLSLNLLSDVIDVIEQLSIFFLLVFVGGKCVQYDQKLYHKSCFICNACQEVIANADFQCRDQYFLCISCHMRLAAIYCIKCHKVSFVLKANKYFLFLIKGI
jgi:hypothetical protein